MLSEETKSDRSGVSPDFKENERGSFIVRFLLRIQSFDLSVDPFVIGEVLHTPSREAQVAAAVLLHQSHAATCCCSTSYFSLYLQQQYVVHSEAVLCSLLLLLTWFTVARSSRCLEAGREARQC